MDHQLLTEASDTSPVKTAAVYGMYTNLWGYCAPLSEQLRICQEFADGSGLLVLPEHTYLESFEGTPARGGASSGYVRLQQAVQEMPKPFDVLLMASTRYWSRRNKGLIEFTDFMHLHNIGVQFVDEKLNSQHPYFKALTGHLDQAIAKYLAQRRKTKRT